MRVVGLAPWPFIPAQTGGTERTLNLFAALGEITAFAIDWENDDSRQQVGGIDYRVIGAPLSARDKAGRLRQNGVVTFDPMPMLVKGDLGELRAQIADLEPDVVVMEHPWLIDFVPDSARLVLDAANCETINTQQQYPRTFDVELVANLERRAVQRADLITYAAEYDAQAIRRLYSPSAPMVHIPNGTDLPETMSDGATCNLIFIGSVYQPNVAAAQLLASQAVLLPEYEIHIIGGCSDYVRNPAENVTLHGHVTDEQRDHLFATAHAFVTLTTHGSGTHLKVSRALAYGLPVVTTPLGARGYDSRGITITTIGDLPEKIRAVSNDWAAQSQLAREQGAELSWAAIQKTFRQAVTGVAL
jgi:glycosyltransferase involved in cell wall biosynthesis